MSNPEPGEHTLTLLTCFSVRCLCSACIGARTFPTDRDFTAGFAEASRIISGRWLIRSLKRDESRAPCGPRLDRTGVAQWVESEFHSARGHLPLVAALESFSS